MPINNPAAKRTIKIAYYMLCRFKHELYPLDDENIPSTVGWTLNQIQEFNQFVDVLVRAFLNKKTLTWAAGDYKAWLEENAPRASGRNQEIESKLEAMFPPLESQLITDPFILCDVDGNILMWYLPGALKKHRTNTIWNDLNTIGNSLTTDEYASSWRINSSIYRNPADCSKLKPGTVSLALAWYQQGHAKSNPLEVSAELRKERGVHWIEQFSDASAMLGAALAIMHPSQFATGIQALEKVFQNPDLVTKSETLPQLLNTWTSPFTGLSVISNRVKTPTHRDTGSAFEWMDLLTTIGKYVDGYLVLPGVGIEVPYWSGTVVALTGKVLAHGASSNGERVCIAQYMKDNVISKLVSEDRQWANVSYLQRL